MSKSERLDRIMPVVMIICTVGTLALLVNSALDRRWGWAVWFLLLFGFFVRELVMLRRRKADPGADDAIAGREDQAGSEAS